MMKSSKTRILTTHVGSLPRPEKLVSMLIKQDKGEPYNASELSKFVSKVTKEIVKQQIKTGIDIINDGEAGKISYHVYAKHRLTGLENVTGQGVPGRPLPRDIKEFPEMVPKPLGGGGTELLQAVMCKGLVGHKNDNPGKTDIDNLRNAIKGLKPEGVFMTSVSPGCLVNYVPNDYYSSRDKYRDALTSAMRPEYELIDNAGFILQLDCPDLAGCRHTDQQDWSDKEFLWEVEKSVEALNEATSNIAPENMRMHICWLNYSGPHTHDIPISKIIGALSKARPQGLLFEGANPRHEHEWEDWKEAKIPDDKILIPGVIDSTNNFVEHPRLVAQRICRYADIVGRERVIAGTDCGFSTYAGRKAVYPSVVYAKLDALADGAKLATDSLW
jgi:5-methyltetrahydropteroyltriglutamate--homocysteine methyltransferase